MIYGDLPIYLLNRNMFIYVPQLIMLNDQVG